MPPKKRKIEKIVVAFLASYGLAFVLSYILGLILSWFLLSLASDSSQVGQWFKVISITLRFIIPAPLLYWFWLRWGKERFVIWTGGTVYLVTILTTLLPLGDAPFPLNVFISGLLMSLLPFFMFIGPVALIYAYVTGLMRKDIVQVVPVVPVAQNSKRKILSSRSTRVILTLFFIWFIFIFPFNGFSLGCGYKEKELPLQEELKGITIIFVNPMILIEDFEGTIGCSKLTRGIKYTLDSKESWDNTAFDKTGIDVFPVASSTQFEFEKRISSRPRGWLRYGLGGIEFYRLLDQGSKVYLASELEFGDFWSGGAQVYKNGQRVGSLVISDDGSVRIH